MLLVLDIGNSTIAWGAFKHQTLEQRGVLPTAEPAKPDGEYDSLLVAQLRTVGIGPDQITGAIMSSVVPELTPVLRHLLAHRFHQIPLLVGPALASGLTIRRVAAHEIGSDRLVNAAYAHAQYPGDLIVVDLGTATTFSLVTAAGEYLGGAIAPGLRTGADALVAKAAQLPAVDLAAPDEVIGQDTRRNLQSGLVYGHAAMVDGMVRQMQAEFGRTTRVVATGGLVHIVAPHCPVLEHVRPFLTLEGLAWLYQEHQLAPPPAHPAS